MVSYHLSLSRLNHGQPGVQGHPETALHAATRGTYSTAMVRSGARAAAGAVHAGR